MFDCQKRIKENILNFKKNIRNIDRLPIIKDVLNSTIITSKTNDLKDKNIKIKTIKQLNESHNLFKKKVEDKNHQLEVTPSLTFRSSYHKQFDNKNIQSVEYIKNKSFKPSYHCTSIQDSLDTVDQDIDTKRTYLTSLENISPTPRSKRPYNEGKDYKSILNLVDHQIEKNKLVQKHLLTYRKENEEIKEKDAYKEIYYNKQDQKEIVRLIRDRPCFFYNLSSKEKTSFFSNDKKNVYYQSEYIGKSNPEGIYKFRNIIYEKYGVNAVRDLNIDPLVKTKVKKSLLKSNAQKIIKILNDSKKINLKNL